MINIIAAIGANRELGKDNELLWDIPGDMKFFREKTKGHPVVMGRKTYESIGKPLPNRTNIVVTRGSGPAGVVVKNSLEEAIELANTINTGEVFIIGGGQIYTQALPLTDRLYLTIVHKSFEADTYFPKYEQEFREVESTDSKDANYSYTFKTYIRI